MLLSIFMKFWAKSSRCFSLALFFFLVAFPTITSNFVMLFKAVHLLQEGAIQLNIFSRKCMPDLSTDHQELGYFLMGYEVGNNTSANKI